MCDKIDDMITSPGIFLLAAVLMCIGHACDLWGRRYAQKSSDVLSEDLPAEERSKIAHMRLDDAKKFLQTAQFCYIAAGVVGFFALMAMIL